MKRLALVAALVLVLAACGGGGKSAGSADEAKIKQTFTSFFSSKEPVENKPALVENGRKFRSAIEGIAANPLASNTSAKVAKVTLDGHSRATVVYSIYLGNTAVLQNIKAYALKENGTWVIADSSLCGLLRKEGGATPACTAVPATP